MSDNQANTQVNVNLNPRTKALLESIAKLGYSSANDQVTSLCWQLEQELSTAQARIRELEGKGPVIGTKSWLEDGKFVQKNIHQADFYEPTAPLSGAKP